MNAEFKVVEKEIIVSKKRVAKAVTAEQGAKNAAMRDAKEGPFKKRFEDALKYFKISRQKYFGGTFVGPDLHTVFNSPQNITYLCAILKAGRFVCPDGIERQFGSDERAAEVETVLQAFGRAHRVFSRKQALCEHEIESFPMLVSDFMVAFAKVYPNEAPTPKMHMLGFHFMDMIERHGSVGMGTEQGIESFHPEFNYVLNHFRLMERNRPAQLAAVAGHLWARGGGNRVRQVPGLREEKQQGEERKRERNKRKVSAIE
jgi:hypothetical protein